MVLLRSVYDRFQRPLVRELRPVSLVDRLQLVPQVDARGGRGRPGPGDGDLTQDPLQLLERLLLRGPQRPKVVVRDLRKGRTRAVSDGGRATKAAAAARARARQRCRRPTACAPTWSWLSSSLHALRSAVSSTSKKTRPSVSGPRKTGFGGSSHARCDAPRREDPADEGRCIGACIGAVPAQCGPEPKFLPC